MKKYFLPYQLFLVFLHQNKQQNKDNQYQNNNSIPYQRIITPILYPTPPQKKTLTINKSFDMQVEICCNSVLSARNAKLGGAYRIELCQALNEGGTTPSAAAIEYCVKKLNLQTRVLIRPRSGNFVYDNEDFKIILSDIQHAHKLGAHAVVFGFLTPNGDIDIEKTRIAVETADGMDTTFHRAFDECRNPKEALEQVIDCGCSKLLTSGCMPSAEKGIPMLRELVIQANGRIGLIAAAGITPQNVSLIVNETNVEQIHASCKKTIDNMVVTDTDTVRDLFNLTNLID